MRSLAASKKNSNSSKTAHVMNLLSKRRETPAPQETNETSEAQAAPAKETRSTPLPPVMASLSPDAAVSNQIRSALEDALEEELLSESSPTLQEEVKEDTLPEPQKAEVTEETPPVSQEENQEEIAPTILEEVQEEATPAPQTQEVKEETVSAPEQEIKEENTPVTQAHDTPDEPSLVLQEEEIKEETLPEPQEALVQETVNSAPQETSQQAIVPQDAPADPTQLICFNVMEELVEEKLEKYVNMFGLCDCPRCLLDVKALALTNLPALYVGIPMFEKNFRLAVYEKRYDSAVTAQILHACKTVMENPRHQESD